MTRRVGQFRASSGQTCKLAEHNNGSTVMATLSAFQVEADKPWIFVLVTVVKSPGAGQPDMLSITTNPSGSCTSRLS
jgi:hypothetical protein